MDFGQDLLLIVVAIWALPLLPCGSSFTAWNSHASRTSRRFHISPSRVMLDASSMSTLDIIVEQIQLSSGTLAEVMSSAPHVSSRSNSNQIFEFEYDDPIDFLKSLFNNKDSLSKEKRNNKGNKPPLVFIHGSFHASWCWTEKFFPYFVDLGYPCYALSLRGTGGTFAGEGVTRVKISEHVEDISAYVEYVTQKSSSTPILVSHSFGGIAVMKYLESKLSDTKKEDEIGNCKQNLINGAIFLCSVPPSGNGKMTLRFLQRSLIDSWKITAGMAMKKCIDDDDLCRTMFFGGKKEISSDGNVVNDKGISDEDLKRYQGYFLRDTVATIDLRDLASKLPSKQINSQGCAPFVDKLPPTLVVGATDDFIVDQEGVRETAQYFGVNPIIVDSPHDVMLGSKWKTTADAIQNWLMTIE